MPSPDLPAPDPPLLKPGFFLAAVFLAGGFDLALAFGAGFLFAASFAALSAHCSVGASVHENRRSGFESKVATHRQHIALVWINRSVRQAPVQIRLLTSRQAIFVQRRGERDGSRGIDRNSKEMTPTKVGATTLLSATSFITPGRNAGFSGWGSASVSSSEMSMGSGFPLIYASMSRHHQALTQSHIQSHTQSLTHPPLNSPSPTPTPIPPAPTCRRQIQRQK